MPAPTINRRCAYVSSRADDEPDESVSENDTDDPVAAAMGHLNDLASELAGLDELGATEAGPEYLPPEFDLFELSARAVERLLEEGRDPTVVRVAVHLTNGSKRGKQIRMYPPQGMTWARLKQALPPGQYDLLAYNSDGVWVGSKRIRINHQQLDELPGQAAGLDSLEGNPSSKGSLGDKILYALAMRALNGNEAHGRGSEMEKATAGMVKLMSVQLQMQQADMMMRLKLMETDARERGRDGNTQLEMLKTIWGLAEKRNAKSSNGNGAGKFEDFVGAMQLGMHFGKMADGRKKPSDESLREWVLPLVDSLGPGAFSLIAMMLPVEKAKMVNDFLEQHQRTREAEARAEADGDDEPDVVNTEGKPVE